MKKSDWLFWILCAGIVAWFAVDKFSASRAKKAWEKDLQERIALDFRRSREEVKTYVAQYIPDVTDGQIDAWTASGKLEAMEIDGQLRYFRNAGPNLFRLDTACTRIKTSTETLSGNSISGHDIDDAEVIPLIVSDVKRQLVEGIKDPYLAQPRTFHVRYTLAVEADAVPAGEKIRCWLPFPRNDAYRQKDVKLLATSEPEYILSRERDAHSTVYMEKTAVAGQPTVFSEEFEYTSYGEWHPASPVDVKPYDTVSKLYKEYTSEREAHMIFTPEIKALADSLKGDLDNPVLIAKRFFTYVNDNFPWASAREYSTVENIPSYVLRSGHGDCGMVTLLLLTLCRYAGIPARWQSGFMMHPHGWNLHDWGELYFEGLGWIPVDQSFGIPPYAARKSLPMGIWGPAGETVLDLPEAEYFYFGGIDPYRMVVNNDYGQFLYPRKVYPRSETVDFQRGEVEWRKGNLYFNKWDYSLEIL